MSAPGPAEYTAVTEFLYGLKPAGGKYGIERMRRLAAELGHPERSLPVVHVAGTNGKGSVAAMLDAILHGAGWRTGLYTSPHLVNLGERVQVDRRMLTLPELLAYTRELVPVAARIEHAQPDERPSFFEYVTAMAFLEFTRRRCDIGVIETGLGGRLDATNIVDPEVSVITSIGLDHCEYLGDGLPAIAREKAGIIKPGRPVVIGRMPAEAEAGWWHFFGLMNPLRLEHEIAAATLMFANQPDQAAERRLVALCTARDAVRRGDFETNAAP